MMTFTVLIKAEMLANSYGELPCFFSSTQSVSEMGTELTTKSIN